MDAELLQFLLVGTLVGMYLLAMLYLRRQPLSLGRYTFWGLFALLVPALGPFLVIAASWPDGRQRHSSRLIRR